VTDNTSDAAEADRALDAPPALVALQDVLYRGVQPPGGGAGKITICTLTGREIATVTHLVKHSPTGMGWGYLGSGASDCARSLLAAVIGEKLAVCVICAGTGQVVFGQNRPPRENDPTATLRACAFCDLGLDLPPAIYHRFKEQFVAVWDNEFGITRGAIVGWLRSTYPGRTWPTIVD
jgi:hypothetical protein